MGEPDAFSPLFREVRRLPCPTLLGAVPDGDTNVMSLDVASLHWGLPAKDLQDFWVATFYPLLAADAVVSTDAATADW